MRMRGIRLTRTADEWLCLAALACQPFMPPISYDLLAELLAEHARREAPSRDDHGRPFR
jgi:hypothetical protein